MTNIHRRTLQQPKEKLVEWFTTLATDQDRVWPSKQWPPMRFKEGLQVGAKGGHGPVRYTVEKMDNWEYIQFRFTQPKGFHGYHRLEINAVTRTQTEIKHVLKMNTSGAATFSWLLVFRPLHDALIEDAFDKVENQFSDQTKRTAWSFWVKFLRNILKKITA
ncbi:MAG TPA: hypothetical protein PKA70_10145 [Saprospiraceae bacterium]|nr:hypothetical protein [Saprospiraceae bacterium]